MSYYQPQQIESVEQLRNALSEYHDEFTYVHQLLQRLMELGMTPKVYSMHDDFMGLPYDLSSSFLNAPLDIPCPPVDSQFLLMGNTHAPAYFADSPVFSEDIEHLLREANIVLTLYYRPMSSYDYEAIKEDRRQIGY